MGKQAKRNFLIIILFLISSFNLSMAYASMMYKQTKQKTEVTGTCNIKVINIVVAKIDKNYIYAKDGRKFSISFTTKIIDNTANKKSKIEIAELIFKNNKLIAIILK